MQERREKEAREKKARERAQRSEMRTEGVACTGERTWEQRDAELRAQAVDIEAEGSAEESEVVDACAADGAADGAAGGAAAPLGAHPPFHPGEGVHDRLHYGDSQQSQLDQARDHEGDVMVGDLFGEVVQNGVAPA